jgi:hypothetical protein
MRRQYKNQPEWAEIGGRRIYFRSRFERRWAEYLELMKKSKAIKEWEYEPKVFEFPKQHGHTRYTPDFKVTSMLGGHIWHECKGWIDGPSKSKLHWMSKYYPDEEIWLVVQGYSKRNKIMRDKCAKYVSRVMDGARELRSLGL